MNASIYSGGDGSSKNAAVVITVSATQEGLRAEYEWLGIQFGKRDVDWHLSMRSHGTSADRRSFETFVITLKNGEERTIYFDITSFYMKFS